MSARKMHVLGVLATTVVAAAVQAGSAGAAAPSARDRALTRAVDRTMQKASIPGAIVGVWTTGRAPYVRAFGVRDTATGRPMAPNLYMRIASETKTFTVTALLQLVGAGKASLDDPIGKYIPGIVNGDTATLRDLADMRSGIPSYTVVPQFGTDFDADPHHDFTRPELLGYIAGVPPLFAPGEGFNYSNTNTVLLGLVVEQLSGQTLPAYLEQHILKPLRMDHTAFSTAPAIPTPHAQGYTRGATAGAKPVNATTWSPSAAWSAGAMTSTVSDMRIWAEHLITGQGLQLPAALQAERLKSVALAPGEDRAYGIGMFNNHGWIGHNGGIAGYQVVVVNRPASKTTLVVLINSDVSYERKANSTWIAGAATRVLTPRHVYDVPASPAR